jgi:FMN phosphatase YigB (HAD superfamily)
VAKLRPFLKLALVTTNVDAFTRFTIKSKKLDSYFDIVVNSADWRMLKSEPGGGIFKHAARMVGLQIQDCVLIDDSPKICSIFKTLGGHAIPTTGVRHTGEILRTLLARLNRGETENLSSASRGPI